MANLEKTKRRMQLIKATGKITKAMEMVAIAKLQRVRAIAERMRPYGMAIEALLKFLSRHVDPQVSPFLTPNGVSKRMHIIITSNIGLCGGYNQGIIRAALPELKQGDLLYIFGSKGARVLVHTDLTTLGVVKQEMLDLSDLQALTNQMVQLYQTGEIGGCDVYYTRFVNSLTFEPVRQELLPIRLAARVDNIQEEPILEPDGPSLMSRLVPFYLQSLLYDYIITARTSENAARRVAMENASDNASELMAALELEFNKARQAEITQEISEIIAGTAS